jgi:hypothetical protein
MTRQQRRQHGMQVAVPASFTATALSHSVAVHVHDKATYQLTRPLSASTVQVDTIFQESVLPKLPELLDTKELAEAWMNDPAKYWENMKNKNRLWMLQSLMAIPWAIAAMLAGGSDGLLSVVIFAEAKAVKGDKVRCGATLVLLLWLLLLLHPCGMDAAGLAAPCFWMHLPHDSGYVHGIFECTSSLQGMFYYLSAQSMHAQVTR